MSAARGVRRQHTFRIDGVRVRITFAQRRPDLPWRLRVKATDPTGDVERELRACARAAALLTEQLVLVDQKVVVGPMRHIDDHEAER